MYKRQEEEGTEMFVSLISAGTRCGDTEDGAAEDGAGLIPNGRSTPRYGATEEVPDGSPETPVAEDGDGATEDEGVAEDRAGPIPNGRSTSRYGATEEVPDGSPGTSVAEDGDGTTEEEAPLMPGG